MMAGDRVMFVECARHRCRPMNSRSHHQHRSRCYVMVTQTMLRRFQARTSQLAVPAVQSLAAAERVDEALAELCAHETVGDRVAAGRDERQQVDVVHGGRGDVCDGVEVVEDAPRLHDVRRRPADEEQDDDDGQHLDAASLGANAACTRQSSAAGTDQLLTRRRTAVSVVRPSPT